MIAADDNELHPWLIDAQQSGGGFVKALAEAALRADTHNYDLLRPSLLAVAAKYPKYGLVERERMRKDGIDI
jgi:hypothetical protein